MRLNDLHARGLLVQKDGPTYRYGPAQADLNSLVERLAAIYHERRVTIITLIYSKPHTQVQAFADAFKLRKD
jgi:hypothetical protein